MVKTLEVLQKDRVKYIEKKLEKCRNQENNPDSAMWVRLMFCFFWTNRLIPIPLSTRYKQRMKKMLEDEDDLEIDTSAYGSTDMNTSQADSSMLSITA